MRLYEGISEILQIRFRDPSAIIGHRENHARVAANGTNTNPATGQSEFHALDTDER
jgi:hypothetical protein